MIDKVTYWNFNIGPDRGTRVQVTQSKEHPANNRLITIVYGTSNHELNITYQEFGELAKKLEEVE